jgi:hypothetical protein
MIFLKSKGYGRKKSGVVELIVNDLGSTDVHILFENNGEQNAKIVLS